MRGPPARPGAFGLLVVLVVFVGVGVGFTFGTVTEPSASTPTTRTTAAVVSSSSSTPKTTTTVTSRSAVGVECKVTGHIDPLAHPAFLYGLGVDQLSLDNLRRFFPDPQPPTAQALNPTARLTPSSFPARRGVILIRSATLGLGDALGSDTSQHTIVFLRLKNPTDKLPLNRPVAELLIDPPPKGSNVLFGLEDVVAKLIKQGGQACSPVNSMLKEAKGGQ